MPSPILDFRRVKELQPATALWDRYGRSSSPHVFKGKTGAALKAWQKPTVKALGRLLGVEREMKTPFKAKRLEAVGLMGYIREKWVLQVAPKTLMPFYLLMPGGNGPFPVVLAFHGHGYGAKDVVALSETGEERPVGQGYHKDFAVTLVREGVAVAVPDISCFGEHKSDFSHLAGQPGVEAPKVCHHTAALAAHLGRSAMGIRVSETMRLVDFLATRKELDTGRLGAMGISGGGMHAFYSTMLDPRIKAVVVSGYFNSFRESVFAFQHCACNFIPGMGAFGEMADLAALIAPRPMVVESGSRDPIFPQSETRKAVAHSKKYWKLLKAGPWPQGDFFEGDHEIHGEVAIPFLKKVL